MTFQGRKVKYAIRSENKRAVQLMLANKLLVICAHAHNKCPTVNGRVRRHVKEVGCEV